MKNETIIRLNAGHDINGNPKRVFVLLVDGEIGDVWPEGYHGQAAIPNEYEGLYKGTTFVVTAGEYREITRQFKISIVRPGSST